MPALTVGELIAALRELDEAMPVYIADWSERYYTPSPLEPGDIGIINDYDENTQYIRGVAHMVLLKGDLE